MTSFSSFLPPRLPWPAPAAPGPANRRRRGRRSCRPGPGRRPRATARRPPDRRRRRTRRRALTGDRRAGAADGTACGGAGGTADRTRASRGGTGDAGAAGHAAAAGRDGAGTADHARAHRRRHAGAGTGGGGCGAAAAVGTAGGRTAVVAVGAAAGERAADRCTVAWSWSSGGAGVAVVAGPARAVVGDHDAGVAVLAATAAPARRTPRGCHRSADRSAGCRRRCPAATAAASAALARRVAGHGAEVLGGLLEVGVELGEGDAGGLLTLGALPVVLRLLQAAARVQQPLQVGLGLVRVGGDRGQRVVVGLGGDQPSWLCFRAPEAVVISSARFSTLDWTSR